MRTDPLQGNSYSPVELDDGQKLVIAMLADLALNPEERQLDAEFIANAVSSGQSWSIRWKHSHIFNEDGEVDPLKVRAVSRNFQMWSHIERSVSNWSPEKKAEYDALVEDYDQDPRYRGYDGNHEDETFIARHLIEVVGRFQEFNEREHNAHMLTADTYGQMEVVFTEVLSQRDNTRYNDLTPQEVATIVNAARV